MPVIELHLLQGYGDAEKTRLMQAVTDAVRSVVPAPPDAVTVMIREMPPSDYLRGGVHRAPAPAAPDPQTTVRGYLDAMEARDLDRARALLGDGFAMTFPGTAPMTTPEELVAWSRPRYKFVTKDYEAFETLPGPDGSAVVYCRGTLAGEWPDGRAFAGIRFIDRFEVDGGKITRQDVWNDLAESRGAA